jgi:acyl-CoA thioesterase-2
MAARNIARMDPALEQLVQQLDLETLEVNLFRGQSADLGGKSVFGGQVVGQALVAAGRTVEGREPHSVHAYFLLPGDMAAPIVYAVERVRDGRSFSARRVQAIQHGQPILSVIASFQAPEQGMEHQAAPPQMPPPESLPSLAELRERWIAAAGQGARGFARGLVYDRAGRLVASVAQEGLIRWAPQRA